jgi:hypothetical protein
MNAAGSDRGNALLLAHCASLDPASSPARERLEDALGAELARKLVWALCSGGSPASDVSGPALGARAVFAA